MHTLTADIWEQSQTSPDQVTKVPPQVHPSWDLEQPTICHSQGESLSKKSKPLYLAKERTKEQLGSHLQISDDSALESGEVECTFVIPDLKIKSYRLLTGTSIVTTELYAIQMACSTVNIFFLCYCCFSVIIDTYDIAVAVDLVGVFFSFLLLYFIILCVCLLFVLGFFSVCFVCLGFLFCFFF